ncbi:MAG: formate/nitrite transporter family protein [Chloroflexi bacterium]|nr:formate/nitrite transporter family protein [Chloroflexota bacterium]
MATSENIFEQEPAHIEGRAESLGSARLDRSNLEILITAIIGGGEVSVGALAAMTVVGALMTTWSAIDLYTALAAAGLVFPVGFIFVIMGRSELFTENFLIPVVSVFKTERTLGSLAQLWGLSWAGNMLGCAGAALLLVMPNAVGGPVLQGYAAYTAYKLDLPWLGVFVSAVLAGGVMSTLTWSLLSVQHSVGRIIIIAAGAYVLIAANLSHSIVSASVLLVGFHMTQHGLGDVIVWLLNASAGNLVGGVGLVTLFRLAQVRQAPEPGAEA